MKLAQIQALYEAIQVSKAAEKSDTEYKLVFDYNGNVYSGIPLNFDPQWSPTFPIFDELDTMGRVNPTPIKSSDEGLAIIQARNYVVKHWYPEYGYKHDIYDHLSVLFSEAVKLSENLSGTVINVPFTDVDILSSGKHLEFMYIPEDANITPLSLISITSEN